MNIARSRFRFTKDFDLHLAREVFEQNPYEDPKRWTQIQMNMLQFTGKNISIRTLRERIPNLVKKYLVKAEFLEGNRHLQIEVTEIDDLIKQIINMSSECQKKRASTTSHQGLKASEKAYSGELFKIEVTENYLDDQIELPEDDISNVSNPLENEESSEAQTIVDNEWEMVSSSIEELSPEKRSLAQANITTSKRMKSNNNIKQEFHNIQYLDNDDREYELRTRELELQERKQLLEENKFEMDRHEKEKKLEIEERRLKIAEKRLEVQKDLIANQQELIKILLNNNKTCNCEI